MDELISRQAAIDGVKTLHEVAWKNWHEPTLSANVVIDMIKELPSAQPEKHTEERTETHACDCISRQAEIDTICEHGTDLERRGITVLAIAAHKQVTVDLLEKLPSAQAEPQWIPCSERLPENNRQVLVYARSVHFALAKYDEMRNANGIYEMQWVTFDAWKPFYKIKEVIAWMPLPEPYKERWEK